MMKNRNTRKGSMNWNMALPSDKCCADSNALMQSKPFWRQTQATMAWVLYLPTFLGVKIIVFVSRTVSDAEKNYPVIEKEMLACFWATKRLRSFLWGMNYTLRTDHKPPMNILTTKGSASESTSHRINRWSSRMLEYNFNVEYLQGINNVVADYLSRVRDYRWKHNLKNTVTICQMISALRRYMLLLKVLFLRAS